MQLKLLIFKRPRRRLVTKKPPLAPTEKLRSASLGKAIPEKKYFQMKRERSPNVQNYGMTRKEKELYEKELKVEMQEKLKKIDERMEKKKKCNIFIIAKKVLKGFFVDFEDFGIFSKEKNEVRLNASKFVAVFREYFFNSKRDQNFNNRKMRLQTKLLHNTKAGISQQQQQPAQDKKSLLTNEISNDTLLYKDDSINYSEDGEWYLRKNDATDNPLLFQMRDLLTRPAVANIGNKVIGLKVYEKRLNDLRRKNNNTKIQESHALNFTRLQVI